PHCPKASLHCASAAPRPRSRVSARASWPRQHGGAERRPRTPARPSGLTPLRRLDASDQLPATGAVGLHDHRLALIEIAGAEHLAGAAVADEDRVGARQGQDLGEVAHVAIATRLHLVGVDVASREAQAHIALAASEGVPRGVHAAAIGAGTNDTERNVQLAKPLADRLRL